MSYYIHYTGTKQEKLDKALADARDYAGEKQWDKIMILMTHILLCDNMSTRKKIRNCRFSLSFAGIQGLPATAIMKYILNVLKN